MSAFPYHPPGATRPLRWVKADLHLHTSEDPHDEIDYSALELVERAHGLGYRVLAVTLHDEVFDDPRVFDRARELGILLIPAVERRLEGADIVLLNVSREESDALGSFDDLRRLRHQRGASLLTIAPHPFYRFGGSVGHRIDAHLDCFDVIEHCHLHIPFFNPNRAARRLAHRHNKPLLATSDCHRASFFGHNFSYVGLAAAGGEAPALTDVFDALRAHRVQRVAPASVWRMLAVFFFIFVQHPILLRSARSKRARARAAHRPAATPLGYPVANERAVV